MLSNNQSICFQVHDFGSVSNNLFLHILNTLIIP